MRTVAYGTAWQDFQRQNSGKSQDLYFITSYSLLSLHINQYFKASSELTVLSARATASIQPMFIPLQQDFISPKISAQISISQLISNISLSQGICQL